MKEDTLKYLEENLKRVIRLQEIINKNELNQVELRDNLIRRNSFLNEAIKVANEELGCNVVPVRYRKLNVESELMALIQIFTKSRTEKEKRESA